MHKYYAYALPANAESPKNGFCPSKRLKLTGFRKMGLAEREREDERWGGPVSSSRACVTTPDAELRVHQLSCNFDSL